MADNNDYRRLLGERLARAEMLAGDIDPPSDKEILRWKRLAQKRRHEKQRRKRALLSLAAVVALAFSINLLPAIEIPDAQADRDDVTEITDGREESEGMLVDTYYDYTEIPQDVKEEFLLLSDPPAGFELTEVRVVTTGKKEELKSLFSNKEGLSFAIRQCNSEAALQAVVNRDRFEMWDGIQVWVKEFTTGDEETAYIFVANGAYFNILTDNGVDKSTIKEAVASLLA